jgi:hypothetical protein
MTPLRWALIWLVIGLWTHVVPAVVGADELEVETGTCNSQWRKGLRTLHPGSETYHDDDDDDDDVECVRQSALRLVQHAAKYQRHQFRDPERALQLATLAAERLSVSGDAGFEGRCHTTVCCCTWLCCSEG